MAEEGLLWSKIARGRMSWDKEGMGQHVMAIGKLGGGVPVGRLGMGWRGGGGEGWQRVELIFSINNVRCQMTVFQPVITRNLL